jgi:hypothetical protein
MSGMEYTVESIAQGSQDAFAHELFPWLAGLQLDDVSGGHVHHVVIEKHLPDGLLRFQVLQAVEQFLAR